MVCGLTLALVLLPARTRQQKRSVCSALRAPPLGDMPLFKW